MRNPLSDEMTSTSVYKLLGFMARHPRGPDASGNTREIARLTLQEIVSVTGVETNKALFALAIMLEAKLLSWTEAAVEPKRYALNRTVLYKNIEAHGWSDWGKTLAAVGDTQEGMAVDTSGMPGAWELHHKGYIATTAVAEDGATTSVITGFGESAYAILKEIFPR